MANCRGEIQYNGNLQMCRWLRDITLSSNVLVSLSWIYLNYWSNKQKLITTHNKKKRFRSKINLLFFTVNVNNPKKGINNLIIVHYVYSIAGIGNRSAEYKKIKVQQQMERKCIDVCMDRSRKLWKFEPEKWNLTLNFNTVRKLEWGCSGLFWTVWY